MRTIGLIIKGEKSVKKENTDKNAEQGDKDAKVQK